MPCDTSDWDRFQKKLNSVEISHYRFYRMAAKELAARMLALVIPRTPVGVYPASTGKQGGTLRRGWVSKTHQQAESGSGLPTAADAKNFAISLPVRHRGNYYQITITNPVKYASYVEYGHRTRGKRFAKTSRANMRPLHYSSSIGLANTNGQRGYVQGQYMLTISEQQLKNIEVGILEKLLERWLKGVFTQ